jgi:hypothetical protein
MIGSYINSLANSNKGIARASGALIGYLGTEPTKHPYMTLLGAGLLAEYWRQKKIDAAEQAARQAAIQVGQTDPACVVDPHSTECMDHAKAAAIQVGLRITRRSGEDRRLSWPVALLLAFLPVCGMIVFFKIHG